MKRFLSLLLFPLLAFAADDCDDACPPCKPCPPADPCAPCAQLWPTRGPDWIITPGAGPCVSCGIDMAVTAEFIFWTAREDHLSYVYSSPLALQGDSSNVAKGRMKDPDWKFYPGFKVGVGVLADHDGWDIYANYTWLRPRNTKHTSTLSTGVSLVDAFGWASTDLFGNDSNTQFISKAEGKWELDFNVVDLELGRNFYISSCLHLRPLFSLKGTWQKQRMDTEYIGTETLVQTPLNVILTGQDRLSYWGIGPRFGFDTAWHFNFCTSFVGEFAATALWEGFKLDRKAVLENTSAGVFDVPIYFDGRFHTIKPVLEFYLGLRWENWFCCDEFHLSLEAGWEVQWWGDQNQFGQVYVGTRNGDLVFQGGTAKIRFDF